MHAGVLRLSGPERLRSGHAWQEGNSLQWENYDTPRFMLPGLLLFLWEQTMHIRRGQGFNFFGNDSKVSRSVLRSTLRMHYRSRPLLAFCICVAAVGCTSGNPSSQAIAAQFDESKGASVNLATAVPGQWEKVCVLGPYSTNETAKKTLAFAWDVKNKTSITTNEGISLLLFLQENKVVAYVEYPRNRGDFSNLTAQCFPKEKSQFVHDQKPAKGWPGLFPKNEA